MDPNSNPPKRCTPLPGWGMDNAQQDGVKIFDPTGKPIGNRR
jgi:hypothetical protein